LANLLQLTPFMRVPDFDKAIAFFVDTLGFELDFHMDNYCYLRRERVAIRMMGNTAEDFAPPGNRRYAYYVDVADVDALYAELKPKLDLLPGDDVFGPCDMPYLQREIGVICPDGNWLVFGQDIRDRQP
jgi:catechol 2,3-dioxygenase-like lactoylglutathione lyase family enzyme